MVRVLMLVFCAFAALCPGYEGLYGVVAGGVVHEYVPECYSDASWIYLSNGLSFDVNAGEPELPAALTSAASEYYIVHFNGPVRNGLRERIDALGGRVYAYIPNYSLLVGMNETVKGEVARIEGVDWIGIYHPAYKISSQEEFRDLRGRHELTIVVYPDAGPDIVQAELDKLGARITDTWFSEWFGIIRCDADLSLVHRIANLEAVNWIEPWHKMEPHNANVQWVVQTATSGNRRVWNMGIRGEGQLLSICDSGVRTSHYAYRSTPSSWITTWGDYPSDRKIVAYQPANSYGPGYADFGDEACNYYHGSHTSGTALGNDDVMGSPNTNDGVAINSRLYFCDGGGSMGSVYIPSSLYALFNLPYTGNAAGSVKIMSNSWGSSVAGQYTTEAMTVDLFTYLFPDFLVCFSNGNDGPGGMTVGSPATAKNCVSVGGCRNGALLNSIFYLSSRGPTQDGRLKPTIITPGQTVTSVYGATDAGYAIMDGTSMSSPSAAASAVLARQYFVEGWYPTGAANPADSLIPSAALLKGMLVVSADRNMSGYTVPDNNVGWGRVDLDSALYFVGDVKDLAVVDHTTGLSTGQYVEYTYNVASNAVPFRVALVWNDYPGTGAAAIKLVNNLNLLVTDPLNNEYKGNVYSSGQSITGGSHDSLNVEECVRIDLPADGNWTIKVSAPNCPYGPQPFALAITADLAGPGVEELPVIHKTGRLNIYPLVGHAVPYRLAYSFETQTPLRVRIYNAAGRVVDERDFGVLSGSGELSLSLDRFASGIYFIRTQAGAISKMSKVIWVK
ncbi:S8 family serine peptidase [candidate division WOR-3 bacterium]|nr:S8 family serine peptidase [candidate division WOR-3 bacterium]